MPRADVSLEFFNREQGIYKAQISGLEQMDDPFKEGSDKPEGRFGFKVKTFIEGEDDESNVMLTIDRKYDKDGNLAKKGKEARTIAKFHILLDAIGYKEGFDLKGRFLAEDGKKVIPDDEIGEYLTEWIAKETNLSGADVLVYVYDKWNKKAHRSYSTIWDQIYSDTKNGKMLIESESKKYQDWYDKSREDSEDEEPTPMETSSKPNKRRM